MSQWIHGMPSIEAVSAHESLHGTRSDGIRLKTITVGRVLRKADYLTPETSRDDHEIDEVPGDESVYGEWIVIHRGGAIGEYVGVNRLKVVRGEVIYAIGFCQWGRLSDCVWAEPSSYFPVGPDGLPLDYTPTPMKGDFK